MELLEFLDYINFNKLNEIDKVKMICFYHHKINNLDVFTFDQIKKFMNDCGYNPNMSRLTKKMTIGPHKFFLYEEKQKFKFIPLILHGLEREYKNYWEDTETIASSSELIDENKFCNKRYYLDRLIKQINNSYSNNCYDACAVLMRRLFEILLILSYQNLGIDNEIKDSNNKGYIMLDGIVKNAKNNNVLKLSRIKNDFDRFRKTGNFSAHNITYTAGKKEIDDIKLEYRVMLEELYNKSNLL
ncbi:hypothetical protein ACYRFS_02950 [Listeria kieliensis]